MKLYKYVLIVVALSCHNKAFGGAKNESTNESTRDIIKTAIYDAFIKASLEVKNFKFLDPRDQNQIFRLHAFQKKVRILRDAYKTYCVMHVKHYDGSISR